MGNWYKFTYRKPGTPIYLVMARETMWSPKSADAATKSCASRQGTVTAKETLGKDRYLIKCKFKLMTGTESQGVEPYMTNKSGKWLECEGAHPSDPAPREKIYRSLMAL